MQNVIHPNALAAKVAAVNAANTEAKRLYPLLVETLKPFYGQKVIKVDGTLLASVAKVLPEMPSYQTTGNRINCYRNNSSYSVGFVIRVSELYTARDYTSQSSHEVFLYICDLKGQVAAPVTGSGGEWVLTARTDYTEGEVCELREAYKVAKEAADKAQSALHPFGEYDR